MNSLYSASRLRNFSSRSACTLCVRCVIQVVTMVAAAPTRDPPAAAPAVMTVESMVSCYYLRYRLRIARLKAPFPCRPRGESVIPAPYS